MDNNNNKAEKAEKVGFVNNFEKRQFGHFVVTET